MLVCYRVRDTSTPPAQIKLTKPQTHKRRLVPSCTLYNWFPVPRWTQQIYTLKLSRYNCFSENVYQDVAASQFLHLLANQYRVSNFVKYLWLIKQNVG